VQLAARHDPLTHQLALALERAARELGARTRPGEVGAIEHRERPTALDDLSRRREHLDHARDDLRADLAVRVLVHGHLAERGDALGHRVAARRAPW
jgi:hypothetical protein